MHKHTHTSNNCEVASRYSSIWIETAPHINESNGNIHEHMPSVELDIKRNYTAIHYDIIDCWTLRVWVCAQCDATRQHNEPCFPRMNESFNSTNDQNHTQHDTTQASKQTNIHIHRNHIKHKKVSIVFHYGMDCWSNCQFMWWWNCVRLYAIPIQIP